MTQVRDTQPEQTNHPIAALVSGTRILRDFLSASKQLRLHDQWTPAQLGAYQASQLDALRTHAYQHSAFYRRFHKGLTDHPLHELPVLTKAIMMENFDDLVTDPAIHLQELEKHLANLRGQERFLGRYWANVTSGSTGRQGIFLFNRPEWAVVVASFSRAYNWAGKTVSLSHRVKMASVASGLPWHLSARVRATLPDWFTPSLRLAAGDCLDTITQGLNEWQPDVLMSFASMARILADEQIAGRLHIAPHTIFSGSEVLTDDTRQHIQTAWGNNLYNQYGVTECGCLGAECTAHRGLHVAEDMVILEAVDRNNQPVQPGQYSEKLLLTVLFNHTQPLIRYELGDSLLLSKVPCPCGRPYVLIEDIEGKIQDTLFFPAAAGGNAIPIHPTVFKQCLYGISATAWQIVQETSGLRILLSGDADQPADEAITRKLADALASRGIAVPPIEVQRVASIPRNPSGKTPLIKSNIANPASRDHAPV